MKSFDELTDDEVVELTDELVNYYIDRECAEEGIKLLPPGGPPIKPNKGTTEDDLELYEIAGHYFRDRDEANSIAFALGQAKTRMTLDYISGPSYRKKAVPASDPVSGVSLVRVLSQERHAQLAQLINEQEAELKTFNDRQREYDKIVQARQTVVTRVHARVREARNALRRREDLAAQFERYLTLANGDRLVAARFLRRAEPDVDQILPNLPVELSTPEIGYRAEPEPVAVLPEDDIPY
jgi:hypothetical protein